MIIDGKELFQIGPNLVAIDINDTTPDEVSKLLDELNSDTQLMLTSDGIPGLIIGSGKRESL